MNNEIILGNQETFARLEDAKKIERQKFLALQPELAQEIISSLFEGFEIEIKEDFQELFITESTIEMKYTPIEIKEIFNSIKYLDVVLVGGQAVNLWAEKYREENAELKNYLPFASEDLDFYGGRLEAVKCHGILGGELTLNNNFDPSPNTGVLIVNFQNKKIRLDFLGSVFGLNDSEILKTFQIVSLKELPENKLKVLHPILCLEGKLKSVVNLPQQGRQDLKHLKMSVLFVKEFLKELCNDENPREGLKLIERIVISSLSEAGLTTWHQHQVFLEKAIPLEVVKTFTHQKWQNFCEIRWPQIETMLQEKRNDYLELMELLEARRKQQSDKKNKD